MSYKFLAYLAAIILILIGTFFSFVYFAEKESSDANLPISPFQKISQIEPAKIDIANWKLYRNEKYGYEMKYPSEWNITTAHLAPAESFSAPSFYLGEAKVLSQLSIGNIHPVSANETIETGLPAADAQAEIIEKKSIKVGGQEAVAIEYIQKNLGRRNGKMGKARREIKVINGGISYLITLDEENDDLDTLDSSRLWKNKEIMDAMVESFRFLDSHQIEAEVPKSAGIVYTNTTFGFSLTLPAGWEKYQASVQKDKGDNHHTYIYFLMPTADKTIGAYDKNTGQLIYGLAEIFVITITDANTWNKDINSQECKTNPNPECPDENSVLAKNSQYVFTVHYGNGTVPQDVQKFLDESSIPGFFNEKFKLN